MNSSTTEQEKFLGILVDTEEFLVITKVMKRL